MADPGRIRKSPEFDRVSIESGTCVRHTSAGFVRNGSTFARFGPSLGRGRPNVGRPILADLGRSSTNTGRNRPKFGRCWRSLGRTRANVWGNFDQHGRSLAGIGRICGVCLICPGVSIDRTWSTSGQQGTSSTPPACRPSGGTALNPEHSVSTAACSRQS